MGNIICKNTVNTGGEFDKSLVKRCGETADISEIFKSKSLQPSRPYYSSELMDRRMAEIRNSIVYIRENWNRYDDFLKDLKETMKDVDFNDVKLIDMFESILRSRKEWAESKLDVGTDTFDTIKLYSHEEGYSKIFSNVNRIFRADDATDSSKLIRSMVFLVELLNIDLFNYCLCEPKVNNFIGTVYRGMALPLADFSAFEDLLSRPISERTISVPLGFMSTSTNMQVGIDFIKMNMTKDTFPLMMKIHVIELKPEYLAMYRARFPSSVVSTICAVDIKDVSYYKSESEILLRGPFFQVLRIYNSKKKYGIEKRMRILEMVMLNTNRDHISTMLLGEHSDSARTLFGTMVAITRAEFAANYCTKMKFKEAVEYKKTVEEKKSRLKELTEPK